VGVLTRLEEPKKHNLSLLQKMKLYDGKTLPGYTQDNVKELRKETRRARAWTASRRATSRTRSPTRSSATSEASINPFMVLNELESGLRSTRSSPTRRSAQALPRAARRREAGVRGHRQERGAARHLADEEAIAKLCANYIDNVKAYTQKEKVKNKYTGQDEEPDERLMRSIEEKIDIPESRKDDFRREIMNYIGALAIEGKTFTTTPTSACTAPSS
jgi:serine protein kinase